MDYMSWKSLQFKAKIVFKSQLLKSNHRVQSKNSVDTYETPVFAPDYRATVLVSKMCTYHY